MPGDAVIREILGDMMIRGQLSKASAALLLTASAFALSTASATAADLGGDCCADLEERIAELEATTARKGNRKVSLEVSGQVNEALMYWDDGEESNVYQTTNDNSRTRFRFKGKAKITSDVEAGYLIEIGVRGGNSKRFTQPDDDAGGELLDIRHSTWYLKSKTYGQVNVGKTGTASEDITEANLSQTGAFAKYSDVEDTGLGLFMRRNGNLSGIQWYRLLKDTGDQPGEGDRENVIRYETPEFAGFSAVAAWGEDDMWDVGIKYAGEHAGFKLAGRIAYMEVTEDPEGTTPPQAGNQINSACLSPSFGAGDGEPDADCESIGGSISIMHEATGLYANFAAGQLKDNLIRTVNPPAPGSTTDFVGADADDTSTFWAAQAGIERKWWDVGKTTIYGEYNHNDGGSNGRRTIDGIDGGVSDGLLVGTGFNDSRILNTEVEMFGFGVAQGIDAAAMTLYLSYRHYEGEVTVKNNTSGAVGEVRTLDLDDLDIVTAGGIIKF